jgi:hypothetical protein
MQLTFSTLQPTTLPEGQHGQAGNSTRISSSSQNGSKVADDSLFDHVFHYFYSPGVIKVALICISHKFMTGSDGVMLSKITPFTGYVVNFELFFVASSSPSLYSILV